MECWKEEVEREAIDMPTDPWGDFASKPLPHGNTQINGYGLN